MTPTTALLSPPDDGRATSRDPAVRRRRFAAEEKPAIVAGYDACTAAGEGERCCARKGCTPRIPPSGGGLVRPVRRPAGLPCLRTPTKAPQSNPAVTHSTKVNPELVAKHANPDGVCVDATCRRPGRDRAGGPHCSAVRSIDGGQRPGARPVSDHCGPATDPLTRGSTRVAPK